MAKKRMTSGQKLQVIRDLLGPTGITQRHSGLGRALVSMQTSIMDKQTLNGICKTYSGAINDVYAALDRETAPAFS